MWLSDPDVWKIIEKESVLISAAGNSVIIQRKASPGHNIDSLNAHSLPQGQKAFSSKEINKLRPDRLGEGSFFKRKFKVTMSVEVVEGLPPILLGAGAKAVIEFEWRRQLPVVVGVLSFLMGRKRTERGITSRRMVEVGLEFAAACWGDDDEASRFEKVCQFRESDLVVVPIDGFDSSIAWNVSFSVLYGNSGDGVKAKELERIGAAMANLVEWIRESLSH
ncbi:hypothetical protein ZIOFF_069831 [Zingiber officinale]|uniref:Uncharacterized protein n=1 Tax=Zingiber officinale TaxID=94328 RepID=A0A8J5EUA4_ZINOF|nr:hypothetical protein ZIOFF_069831 [Zingiber officinale]